AGLDLLSRSRFRSDQRRFLQIYRHESPARVGDNAIALGERCSTADLLLRSSLVSALARSDFLDRVRFALGPDRRTDRLERNHASRPISSGRARSAWRSRIVDPADALLVQFERRVSLFSVRRRRCAFASAHFWNRARARARRPGDFLSVAHRRWADVSEFSVGHSFNRNGIPRDLSRAVATLVDESERAAGLARRDVSAQALTFQTDAHVGHGEVDQR